MLTKASQVKVDPSKVEQANAILKEYWGTTGPDKALRVADVRRLKLKPPEVEDALDALPPRGTTGTTGQRIDECYRVLERL